jgi:hypothetical protein
MKGSAVIWKRFVFVLMAGLLVVSMAACQPTPAEDVVKGKSLDRMIDMASTQSPSGSPAAGTLAAKLGAPQRYKDAFTDAAGSVSVSIDAEVNVPDCSAIRILQVARTDFQQDTVRALMALLLHGQLYQANNICIDSKKDIMARMTLLKAELARCAADPQKCAGIRMEISELELMYKNASEEPVPVSGKLEPVTYADEQGNRRVSESVLSLQGIAHSAQGCETFSWMSSEADIALFYIREKQYDIPPMRAMGGYITADEAYDPAADPSEGQKAMSGIGIDTIRSIPDIALRKEDAIAQADDLIKKINMDSFTCNSVQKAYGDVMMYTHGDGAVNPLRCVWRLRYTRTVDGLPTTYTSDGCYSAQDDQQASPWEYESISVYIDDSGIVGFEWHSPYLVTGTKLEDAKVLPFQKIMEIFKKMSIARYAGAPSGCSHDFQITKIQFGLTRVTEQNKRDAGILVPVWDFFGTKTFMRDGAVESVIADPERSCLTINAIDGSVINRNLGY